ncbi:MAG: voltage-gated potassium channel [Planctomycetota bacterium]|jgi:voltage-gated potassium channel
MRIARAIRILRVIRLLLRARRFRGKGVKLLRVIGVVGATVFAGALGLMVVEPETVSDLDDALWWSIITISTVGYGDFTPVTGAGRVVASVLVLSGIGVFGFVAGFMASLMDDPEEDAILAAVQRIEARVDALHFAKDAGD